MFDRWKQKSHEEKMQFVTKDVPAIFLVVVGAIIILTTFFFDVANLLFYIGKNINP